MSNIFFVLRKDSYKNNTKLMVNNNSSINNNQILNRGLIDENQVLNGAFLNINPIIYTSHYIIKGIPYNLILKNHSIIITDNKDSILTKYDKKEDKEFIYKILSINNYSDINIYLNINKNIIFFKGNNGYKSLGYNDDKFMISNIYFENEISPYYVYYYLYDNNKIIKIPKNLDIDVFNYQYNIDNWEYNINTSDIMLSNSNTSDIMLSNSNNGTDSHNIDMNIINNTDLLNNMYNSNKYKINREYDNILSNSNINNAVDKLEEILKNVLRKMIENKKIKIPVLMFSGGIDSLILTLILIKLGNIEKIILINTMFYDENNKKLSFDRKQGLKNYYLLLDYIERMHKNNDMNHCINYNDNNDIKYNKTIIEFIENDIKYSEINCELIKKIIYPKKSNMDINIGLSHFYGSKCALKYSKNIILGSGADEIFGGYSLYKKNINFRNIMKNDYFNMWNRNFGRDDRVMNINDIECLYPFMDDDVVDFSFKLPDCLIIKSDNRINDNRMSVGDTNDNKICDDKMKDNDLKDKIILRLFLIKNGFKESAMIKKCAIQYGSGIFKYEKKKKHDY